MRILVSNDDGYQSRGIQILAEALSELADVIVVAPDQDRSAASHSLTLTRPLWVNKISENIYSIDGTPTDCVHLAITGILKDCQPDMVISGINHGENLGDDVLYSGTVAAAIEGRFLGFPALAVSALTSSPKCLETAAIVTQKIVKSLVAGPLSQVLSPDVVLNMNVPDCSGQDLRGIQSTRLGNRHLSEPAIVAKDPRDRTIYWVGSQGQEQDAGEGTDFFAVANNFVSMTPLHVDMTRHQDVGNLGKWLADFHLQE